MRLLYFAYVNLDRPNACRSHTLGLLGGLAANGCLVDAAVPAPSAALRAEELPDIVRDGYSTSELSVYGVGRDVGMTSEPTKAMKAVLIGSIRAEEAKGCPRWCRKKYATPPSDCSPGTYPLRYSRSRLSTSSVTCCFTTAATFRGILMVRLRSSVAFVAHRPLGGPTREVVRPSLRSSHDRGLLVKHSGLAGWAEEQGLPCSQGLSSRREAAVKGSHREPRSGHRPLTAGGRAQATSVNPERTINNSNASSV